MFTDKSWKSQIHIHCSVGSYHLFYSSLMIAINFTMPHLTLPSLPFCSQCAEHEQPAVWLSHAVVGALADWQSVPAVCLCCLCSSCQPSWSERLFHQPWRICLWSVPFSIFSFYFIFILFPVWCMVDYNFHTAASCFTLEVLFTGFINKMCRSWNPVFSAEVDHCIALLVLAYFI